jgi:hypothetical protein
LFVYLSIDKVGGEKMKFFMGGLVVGARIEKLQRDFLWGGISDEFKYHLVS